MARINYATLYYDTKTERGTVRFVEDAAEANPVVMLDAVNDWIHHLEQEQKRLHTMLYPRETN